MENIYVKNAKDIFLEIGYIDKQENINWRKKIRELTNEEVDCEAVERYCRKQFEDRGKIFFDYRMKPSPEDLAEYLILRTGVSFFGTEDEILVQYRRGKKHGGWIGIEFVKRGGSLRRQRSIGLFGFAYFDKDRDWTEELAQKAAPEIWTLKSSKRENDVLFKFISWLFGVFSGKCRLNPRSNGASGGVSGDQIEGLSVGCVADLI